MDWYLDAHQFKFFVKPYFLRLTFEKELVEDGRESAHYDLESGCFSFADVNPTCETQLVVA